MLLLQKVPNLMFDRISSLRGQRRHGALTNYDETNHFKPSYLSDVDNLAKFQQSASKTAVTKDR